MQGDRKIGKYLEARQEYEALKRQRDDLNGGDSTAWMARWGASLAQARTAMLLTRAALTGGELGRAERMLREETHGPDRG